MFLDLERKASTVGLSLKTNKTKILSLTGHPGTARICNNGRNIEGFVQFIHLGSVVPVAALN